MDTNNKEVYEAPTILVVEVRAEGIICQSGDMNSPGDYPNGGNPFFGA